MKRSFLASLVAVAFSSLTLVACAVQPGDESSDDLEEDSSGTSEDAVNSAIATTVFSDPNATVPSTAAHRIFTSARSYRSYFGSDAPASVDFNKSWVAFYGAGMKTSGGYNASIPSVSRSTSGKTIKITTALSSPGNDCMVTMAITNPHVFVKFNKQPSAQYVTYAAKDSVRSCTLNSCATVRCSANTHCEVSASGAVGCVPNTNPCAVMRCAAGTTCTPDANNQTAQCVKNPGGCTTDADCTLYDNYCGGCACDVLGFNQKPVTCTNPVMCLRQPCGGETVKCESGSCVKQ